MRWSLPSCTLAVLLVVSAAPAADAPASAPVADRRSSNAAPATASEPRPARLVEELLRLTREAEQRGLKKRAMDLVEEAIQQAPQDPRPLYVRASLHQRSRMWGAADADLTHALTLAPAEPGVLFERAMVRFRMAKFESAVADFDRLVELRPARAAELWQRGIALFYANRPDDARRQFELHRSANPNDVENSAWHFACLARIAGAQVARERWMPVSGDPRIPMAQIQELMLGSGTAEEVEKAVANVADDRRTEAEFYAQLYLALYYGATGDAKAEVRHITRAAALGERFGIMGDIAQLHAEWVALRLGAKKP